MPGFVDEITNRMRMDLTPAPTPTPAFQRGAHTRGGERDKVAEVLLFLHPRIDSSALFVLTDAHPLTHFPVRRPWPWLVPIRQSLIRETEIPGSACNPQS